MHGDQSSDGGAGARRRAGGCECGAVRYEVEDAFAYALNCHCSLPQYPEDPAG